ncbi:hypothetical protein BJP08_09995 [Corynebacterium sp. NML140438]|uniref:hypothetical protein n=1 Tax=Corynebacterium sp. NML140438 TaxID=1906334 RepID=UPI0008FB4E9B|nr:hypothetical protein [Corynebacterium sp. NML140438]OIR40803.1 hypothetical protein BJP08_09995 [Corynebacterium sp. NML140438]
MDAILPSGAGKGPGHEKVVASFVTRADWGDTKFPSVVAATLGFANPSAENPESGARTRRARELSS